MFRIGEVPKVDANDGSTTLARVAREPHPGGTAMTQIKNARALVSVFIVALALAAGTADAAGKSAKGKPTTRTAKGATRTVKDAPSLTGVADYSPDGVAVTPMRIKANQDRARAAVKAFERRRAANVLPKSMLPARA